MKRLSLLIALLGLSSCSSVSYLLQAGKGQLALFNRARPLHEVLEDETTPLRIKRLLAEVPRVKSFGESMGLKATSNYGSYVKLDRPYVVTVVAACEELSFNARKWSFPIVGSFPYLGFFDPGMAEEYGTELRKSGLDVEVRGATAYSTLGWFNDSVLSSMITEGPDAYGELVDVVLHESVHASHYVDDQSYYNESLASFIAEGLTRLYIEKALGKGSEEEKAYLAQQEYSRSVQNGLHEAYSRLEKVYASDLSVGEKRLRKREILDEVKSRLRIRRELNNATLIQFKTYRSGREAFARLHERCGRDWRRTLRTLFSVGKERFTESQTENLDPVLDPVSCVPTMTLGSRD